eukprot:TRINITY_DN82195_c0_g1_i1.p1 TRINITY_DN82195_c0_g1~~TRINITY_DN82195_c0_g1_i1.p1  ORF type:complete len:583 (+),score=153.15 TRINITY_DN82195_c0_g1_i1:141-1889(+)
MATSYRAIAQVLLGCLLGWCSTAAGDKFLARPTLQQIAGVADPALLQRLVGEVEGALGGELSLRTKRRLHQIEDMLRPTFWALPKNAHGRLDHAAVRYALHRLFVQRHGWFIRGFQQESIVTEDWNMSSTAAAKLLQGQEPGLVQEIFEKRVGDRGSSLHDVAALAALFEHLIHEDMRTRLSNVYQLNEVEASATTGRSSAVGLVQMYMVFYIQGHTDFSSMSLSDAQFLMENVLLIYPAWEKAAEMIQQVMTDLVPGKEQLSFEDLGHVVEEASHRFYDLVHKSQCIHTKQMLLEMEDGGSGRVKLLDFYRAAIYENKYQFTETIDYLRQIGTLDESDTLVPRVIIPNYVSGQSNCVARTNYVAVCCPDDCESRFDHLEHVLKRPEAAPSEILAWLSDDEYEGISQLLVRRLDEIAAHHGGVVPLHGRLFAQWMHFAHPQSCVYPHKSGSTYTKTTEEWEEDTGGRAGSTVEELVDWEKSLSENHENSKAREGEEVSSQAADMWTMEEELVVCKAALPERVGSTAGSGVQPPRVAPSLAIAAKVALFAAIFGTALWFLHSSRASEPGAKGGWKSHATHHYV